MSLTTAAPLLALLRENQDSVKTYALESINNVVDQLWSEISNELPDIEALYDDDTFSDREMAALIASKVYYNLGEYESAVKYALAAKDRFDIDEKSQFVETIVSKSIEMYVQEASKQYTKDEQFYTKDIIDPKLTSIFERMIEKCLKASELKLALGIALEGYRLDIIGSALKSKLDQDSTSENVKIINYLLTLAITTVTNSKFRSSILRKSFDFLMNMPNCDYLTLNKVVVNLNDAGLALQLFKKLKEENDEGLSAQIAFDLVSSASQQLLEILVTELTAQGYDSALLNILSGLPTCDYYNTFLLNNKNIDIGLLNKSKSSLDGKFSLFHTAVSVANGFMHAGTTDNSFIKANLPWLGKAQNWAKFTATASLGVIHKGNLLEGKKVMAPYLPGSRASSRFIKGGSLYGLGLIYAGFGRDTTDYLKNIIVENSGTSGDEDVDVLLHGASLGIGLAAMGSANIEVYEALKEVLYNDSATSGEAAALGMGLCMLGTGKPEAIHDMFTYSQETQHGNITRGLAVGLALINYGRQELADDLITKMLASDESLLRYGGAFTIALAYAGTGNNSAVKRLLHVAVSDSNDDVRRAAVIALGFVLLRDYTTVPRIVQLLSKSHNAHVRCGTAFALGIACAGKGLQSAIDVLDPLTKDPVDFVRQAAMIALSMILIQQTEKLNPQVADINKNFLSVITNKHQEGLAKFGACVAQGIMNAGGRNVTIQLENADTGTLDTKSVVGLVIFSQFWYWFPLAHFLSLSFTPTTVIGIRGSDQAIPKFQMNCYAKEDAFSYPKMYEEASGKEVEKVATAVLSTTARAKARAKKTKKEKGPNEEEKKKEHEEKEKERETNKKGIKETKENDEEFYKNKYSSKPYKVDNMTRILPQQSRYISFIKDDRFVPVRKFKGNNGVVVLRDREPKEPVALIETVRQMKDVNAPLPTPFKVEDNVDFPSA
ncbi:BAQ_1a_G0026460.mRNA.1.CDS.1 [Saccharomyces cerevisiae]|nr:BAM_G0026440.mRNA.1.CDS.1 [Saccharomyces cerevisiae]CAI4398042.1 BAQ_1a_G0026460.mRNA.1.CDS.1 [Saccharomyces cerevisiae]CAI7078505.1 BAM_G0026440.mRNA.1.CDS.1 [Saccharomyces cerevisiae]CAI7091235.1 BAQ_1a_G0026460.mRNA.1.CDS.1 [Saccharomyces cerevisiae]